MKAYECLYILHPAAAEPELKQSADKYGKIITEQGGTLNKTDIWGKRELAYRIRNLTSGNYILLRFEGDNNVLDHLSHGFRVDDRVFRNMITYEIPEGTGYNDEIMVLSEKKERPRRGRRRFERRPGGGGRFSGGPRRDEGDRPRPPREETAAPPQVAPAEASAPASDSPENPSAGGEE